MGRTYGRPRAQQHQRLMNIRARPLAPSFHRGRLGTSSRLPTFQGRLPLTLEVLLGKAGQERLRPLWLLLGAHFRPSSNLAVQKSEHNLRTADIPVFGLPQSYCQGLVSSNCICQCLP